MNMKLADFKTCFLLIFMLLIGGCSTVSDAGYFWGKYPYTYLETIRNPSEESSSKHIAELRKIIDYSIEENLKPAPGIYAELAFWLSKTEDSDANAVNSFFAKEMQLYPESRAFIERLTSN
jgi:hypothetical protein